MTAKPRQGFWGLWNISFGFFGIQIGFALQNANMSRIFQSLGTSVDNLAFLWIAAPLTGLIVQPLIGHFSDRTWTRLGRRRPFFLCGATLASLALIGMPNAHLLLAAAVLLWLLDASLNVSMEPFRAFVGDMLDGSQQTAGYAFQTAFIGAGAVLGSLAPKLFVDVFHLANTAAPGVVPPSVRAAFYLGATALFGAVLWTVVTTREYSPEKMASFAGGDGTPECLGPLTLPRTGPLWLVAGLAIIGLVGALALDKAVYVLGGMVAVFGLAQIVSRWRSGNDAIAQIISDLATMPPTMRRLAIVQFFTWSALFILWIYTTPVVTQNFFGTVDPASSAYNDGADRVDELFAVYNGVAAMWAFAIPPIARRIGAARTHVVGLLCGAAGFAMFVIVRDASALIGAMVLIGIAWASILTMPYVILARTLPPAKLGIYMGLFNIFIVVPQLIVSSVMGALIRVAFPANPLPVMAVASGVLVCAALVMLTVEGKVSEDQARAVYRKSFDR